MCTKMPKTIVKQIKQYALDNDTTSTAVVIESVQWVSKEKEEIVEYLMACLPKSLEKVRSEGQQHHKSVQKERLLVKPSMWVCL